MAHVTSVHYAIGTVPHLNHSNLFYLSDDNSSADGADSSCSVMYTTLSALLVSKSF